jgi:DNA replication and repair protein RecF
VAEALQVTVFSPDDLDLVKEGPQHRRQYLDELLAALHPRHDTALGDLERVLRQRNTLLKQAAGRLSPDVVATLDVWDTKLAEVGEALALARQELVGALRAGVAGVFARLADLHSPALVHLEYQRSWEGSLQDALTAARAEDIRRCVSTVGPHRDELWLAIGDMPARTHCSQGEQRCLALSLRLAGHGVVAERLETSPVLLLDDVFSELDADRAAALIQLLPPGQALLTTAGIPPPAARVEATVRVVDGKVLT